eukprot:scaffold3011_cov130-Skeletonema_marinoi.AAC.4
MGVDEVENLVQGLEVFEGIVGKDKEGPFYFDFDCGVVKHVDLDASGEEDIFTIGRKGKLVTMKDVIETLRQVCNDDNLEEWRWSGRSFYFQGYQDYQNELGLLEMLRQLVQRGALNMYSIHILT